MNNDDLKKIQQSFKEEVRPLKEILEVVHQKVNTFSGSQTLLASQVRSIKDQQSVINEKLDDQTKILTEHSGTLDALLGDVIDLQNQVGAIWDKISLDFDRNQREIKEIKDHIGLSSNMDV